MKVKILLGLLAFAFGSTGSASAFPIGVGYTEGFFTFGSVSNPAGVGASASWFLSDGSQGSDIENLSITVGSSASPTTIEIFVAQDNGYPGDVFDLVLGDGTTESVTPWSVAFNTAQGHYTGWLVNYQLPANTTTTIDLTAVHIAQNPGTGGFWNITVSHMPEPTSALLAGIAFLFVGAGIRRR